MSYILDALKKSDQERQHNNGPNLQSVQRPHLIEKSTRPPYLLLLLSVLLLIAIVAAGWFYFGMTNLQPNSKSAASAGLALKAEADVVVPKPAPLEPAPTNVVGNAEIMLVEFWQLPDPVQKQIPAMTFSFHVYTENPDRRTIIINKQRFKQGGTVSNGLVLEEITPQGVVFNWQNSHRFTINVVENW